jgi:hypothetical protein
VVRGNSGSATCIKCRSSGNSNGDIRLRGSQLDASINLSTPYGSVQRAIGNLSKVTVTSSSNNCESLGITLATHQLSTIGIDVDIPRLVIIGIDIDRLDSECTPDSLSMTQHTNRLGITLSGMYTNRLDNA